MKFGFGRIMYCDETLKTDFLVVESFRRPDLTLRSNVINHSLVNCKLGLMSQYRVSEPKMVFQAVLSLLHCPHPFRFEIIRNHLNAQDTLKRVRWWSKPRQLIWLKTKFWFHNKQKVHSDWLVLNTMCPHFKRFSELFPAFGGFRNVRVQNCKFSRLFGGKSDDPIGWSHGQY